MPNNNSMLTIAMLSEHGDPIAPLGGQQSGGQNVYVYELSRALSNLGVKVDVFTRWENRKSAQKIRFAKHAKVVRLKAGPRQFISKDKFGPLMPEFVEHFLEYARTAKRKYDVIHTHYYYSGWAGMQLKHLLHIPLVATYHSLGIYKKKALGSRDTSPLQRIKIEKKIAELSDKIITTSPQEKVCLISEYQTDPNKVIVIPAGVNIRRFSHLDRTLARKRLGIPLDKIIVMFAGKMERRKGAITLVTAIRVIKHTYPELYKKLSVLLLSGDPRTQRHKEKQEATARHDVKDAIFTMGVSDTVKLLPGVGQELLHFYYGAANVVVIPSYYESFGMVAIEAMATGTPIVASEVGGLQWIVEDGITGFHAKPKDAKGFARQIVKILIHPELAHRLSKNAMIRVHRNYSWPLIAESVLDVYEHLVERNRLR